MGYEVLKVTQSPVIFENIESVKSNLDLILADVAGLPQDDDALKYIKCIRAKLSKEFETLDGQRKAVKRDILRPYEEAEAKYKECVAEPYKEADARLKSWIDNYQETLKGECRSVLIDYFTELCVFMRIDFLKFEDCGVSVDMTLARQKTPQKGLDQIFSFVTMVHENLELISGMDDSAEILAEYKKCLSLHGAVEAVKARKKEVSSAASAVNAIRSAQEKDEHETQKIMEAMEEAEPADVISLPFVATGTLDQLKKMKNYALSIGIRLEQSKEENNE